ncbi:MAG: hypothetical protein AAFX53_06730 [Bacteroidota bacterium]
MDNSLRYISISHKTASLAQREVFHIPQTKKERLVTDIRAVFPDVMGLLLLVTCNRTEVYFESTKTSALVMRNFLVRKMSQSTELASLFRHSDTSERTIHHLLEVSSGLASSVLGDVEIVHQIKKAYHFSMNRNLQGSLLERAMQTVFKSHKRISNETLFRDGTTSVAYKTLKVIHHAYDRASVKEKKVLIIGAGDIVKQLFKYNAKFGFNNIYIGNRTEERAKILARRHHAQVYEWDRILANDFQGFDVIIGAVGNCANLVRRIGGIGEVLLVDLAVPGSIDPKLSRQKNTVFYNLDTISMDLEETKDKRKGAIGKVGQIISEELTEYTKWLQGAPGRAFLAAYKTLVQQKVVAHFETEATQCNPLMVKTVTDRVIRKVRRRAGTSSSVPAEEMDAVIAEQASFL